MNISYFGKYTENAVNGVDVTGYIVAKEIVSLGHNVFCYVLGDKEGYYEDSGIKIRVFKREGKYSLPDKFKEYIIANEDKIEIFHLRSVFTFSNYLISRFLSKIQFPYVITPHGGYDVNIMNRGKLKKKLYYAIFERYYLHGARGVISCSGESEIQDVKRLGYMGLTEIIWDPVYTTKTFIPKKNKKLIFLGRYDMDHKGLDHSLKIFKEIHKLDQEYTLDLYGSGPHKEDLISLKEELNLKNVTINDPVYEKEKDEVLNNCNAYLQVSRWEAFGRSIMEAISQGLPVIVSPGFNLSDIVTQQNLGLVVDYDYAKSAKKIIDYLSDHNSLIEISKNNIEFSRKEYDPELIAKQNVEFYKKASINN